MKNAKADGLPGRNSFNMTVLIIGGGFAGCEAAAYLAKNGADVTLYEMKPARYSAAHSSEDLCELVCSNSFKAQRVSSASGLLKAEMLRLDSLTVRCALETSVPAGGALAVDRNKFSALVTRRIGEYNNVTVKREELRIIPDGFDAVIVAAGPLCSDGLADTVRGVCGEDFLSFFDAAAPVVTADSVDMDRAFAQSRYDRGDADDYVNCPLDREEYELFYRELISAEQAQLHEFDRHIYEGCMPVEIMARRGPDTIRFGPMKPVGLTDPRTGRRPWANLQLRKENREGTMYNLVGFQTNLKFGEQKRVFSLIPALHDAEFVRYGVMHRNTFLDAPRVLTAAQSVRGRPGLFFAGQITGVEGYMESAASGITAGINCLRYLKGQEALIFPETTLLGAFQRYVSSGGTADYQPMGASFGLLPPLPERIKNKQERYESLARRSLAALDETIKR